MIWIIVLVVIVVITGTQLIGEDVYLVILAFLTPFIISPIYKKCIKKRSKPLRYSFWNHYWYDMKCKLTVIPVILLLSGCYVWLIK